MDKKELLRRWTLGYVEPSLFYLPIKKAKKVEHLVSINTNVEWLNYGNVNENGLFYIFNKNKKIINSTPTSLINLPEGEYYAVQSIYNKGAKPQNNVYRFKVGSAYYIDGSVVRLGLKNEQIQYEMTFDFEPYTQNVFGKGIAFSILYSETEDFKYYNVMSIGMWNQLINKELSPNIFDWRIYNNKNVWDNKDSIPNYQFTYNGKTIYVKYVKDDIGKDYQDKYDHYQVVYNVKGNGISLKYKQTYVRDIYGEYNVCSGACSSKYGNFIIDNPMKHLNKPFQVVYYIPFINNQSNASQISLIEDNQISTQEFKFPEMYTIDYYLKSNYYYQGKPFFLEDGDYLGDLPNGDGWETDGNFEFDKHCKINDRVWSWKIEEDTESLIKNRIWFGDVCQETILSLQECENILNSSSSVIDLN